MPLLFFLVRIIGKKIRSVGREYRKNIGSLTTHIHETLTGIEAVKAFANEEMEIGEFGKKTQRYKDSSSKLARHQKFLEPVSELLVYLIIMLIIGVGSIFIVRGKWELKMLTEYMMLLGFMSMPVRVLPRVIANFKVAAASMDRINSLLAIEPQIVESENPVIRKIDGVIEFKDVRFSYDYQKDVLHAVSFHADKGDIVALVGPSGAGKTTIANLIPRFYDCREGAVLIDGINIKDYGIRSLRTQVGIVSQNISLFNTTIRDNIMYAKREATEQEIFEAARKAYAYDFIMELPKQFETNVGEKGVKLSGGQKQRISIARTILMNPDILILDEATSALDSESEHYIQLAINELMAGRTSVIIAHRLSTISHATKIVVMNKGTIVDIGSHDELFARCALYKKIYNFQYFR
jgi:ABC-type multidrug transport system fused ATPase/permease subunit